MSNKIKKTILLVEDEAITAMVTGQTIEKFGYRAIIAHSGEEALDTLDKEKDINLVLIDIELGEGINGIETARRILKQKSIPLVFLTSHADEEYFDQVKKITRYGYIIKNSANLVLKSSIEMAFALFEEHQKTAESETRYRNFINYSTEGIYRIDIIPPAPVSLPTKELVQYLNRHSTISEVNSAFSKMYGLIPEDMIGKKAIHFAPDYGDRAEGLLHEKNYQIAHIDTTDIDTEGNPIYLEESFQGEIKDGFFYRVWGMQRDVSDRRIAIEKLKESESVYRSTINNLLVGVVVHDKNNKILLSNREAKRILGLTEEEMLGTKDISPKWRFLNEDSSIMKRKDFPANRVITTERPLNNYVLGVTHPERKHVTWLNINASPIFSGKGSLDKVVVNFADITELKEMNEALERRITVLTEQPGETHNISFEDLFSLEEIQCLQDEFAAATGVASIITSTNGTPITKPSNFCRLCSEIIRSTEKGKLNCHKSDAIVGAGNPKGPIVQPCVSGGLWDAGAAITIGGYHIANWLIGQVRDNTQAEDSIRTYARKIGADEEDAVAAFYEVPVMSRERFERIARVLYTLANQLSSAAYQNLRQARYISQARQLQSDLSEAQNYIENIINSMPSILIGVNTRGKVTRWNRKAEETTGVSFEEARGKSLIEVFPEISSKMEKIFESIKKREVTSETKSSRQTDEGPCYENITVYPLASNGIQGAVIRIDDVTHQHLLEEQLNQSRKMDAIGQLAGGIAHDFNNMLGGIMSAAQLVTSRAELSEKDLKYMNMIVQTSHRAAELTARLLAFARKGKTSSAVIDINTILHDTLTILERSIDKKVNITISKKAKKHTITGDDSHLQNAFINICINAGHAMPEGGDIIIVTENIELDNEYCQKSPFDIIPGEYLKLTFRDTGTGIPERNLSKIFEPFFTTREQGKGTGLGLSAVYGTIQDHHGAITVESETGRGTAFFIFLPVTIEKAAKKLENNQVHSGSGEILLVDDEEIIRTTAAAMLEEMNYRVTTAANGMEALQYYRKKHNEIDLVILDMIMPKMNGREVFDKIKEIDDSARVIISSGFLHLEALEDLKTNGLSGFINKPYSRSELSMVVKEVIAGRPAL